MKYACLIYGDGNLVDPVSESDLNRLLDDTLAYHEELRKSGQLILSQILSRDSTTTIKKSHGRISVTDGPFMETKEQLGGFFLIEARDLNEALRIAAEHPVADGDTIEVRATYDPGA